MPDDLTQKIRDRLHSLLAAAQRDADTVPDPADKAVFQHLIDAVGSTLQNAEESLADEAV